MNLNKDAYQLGISEARKEISRLYKLISAEEKTIKEFEKEIELIEASEKQYGDCKECGKLPASIDYNGRGFYVCRSCNYRLERFFEEEYD